MFNQCWVLELCVVIEFLWDLTQVSDIVILYSVNKLYIFKLIFKYTSSLRPMKCT